MAHRSLPNGYVVMLREQFLDADRAVWSGGVTTPSGSVLYTGTFRDKERAKRVAIRAARRHARKAVR